MKEFAQALSLADCVMLTDIYPARETDTLGVSSADIVALLKERESMPGICPHLTIWKNLFWKIVHKVIC